MQFLVLGAGMMGSAAAYDLALYGRNDEIVLADIDKDAAEQSARVIGMNVRPLHLDVRHTADLERALHGIDAVVSAMSYTVNSEVAAVALRAGVHLCDMGGNDDVVDRQLALDAEARAAGVTVVPNCGLAPGLINVLAMMGVTECDSVESVHLRVGGLPQTPRPPLNYQIVFSAEGLINEYVEPAVVLSDGVITSRESLTGLETLEFPQPYGIVEAFFTSGGVSLLPRLLQGRVRTLDYKTIRYRGHCERFKTLLDLGFASNEPVMVGNGIRTSREVFTELLRRKLSYGEPDVVLARATVTGCSSGKRRTIVYEMIDTYDPEARMTAMMRTTAFPTAVIGRMLADGRISRRGVFPPEVCVPGEALLHELELRGIHITRTVTEATL
jgi:lysine 6-dehydrogenase